MWKHFILSAQYRSESRPPLSYRTFPSIWEGSVWNILELRLLVLLGLNNGESLHALAGDVHFSKQGELRDRTYEDQLNAASSLNLLLAAIVW